MRRIILGLAFVGGCFLTPNNNCFESGCDDGLVCTESEDGSAQCLPVCGNGQVDEGEACDSSAGDLGGGAACDSACELLVGAGCGDGVPEAGAYCLGAAQAVSVNAEALDRVDFDLDGDLDLILHAGTDQREVAFQDDDLSFSRRSQPLQSRGRFEDAVDLNGDGLLDLVFADNATGIVETFLQGANGAFLDDAALSAKAPLVYGDLNSDGRLDVIARLPDDSGSRVFLRGASGLFDVTLTLAPGFLTSDNDLLPGDTLNDWDGDGDLDWLAVRSDNGSSSLELLSNDGAGSLSNTATLVQLPPSDGFTGSGKIDLADWDGDGDLDIMVGRAGEGVALLVNSAGVVSSRAIPTTDIPINGLAADFNGDAHPDLLLTFLLDGVMTLSLLENDGAGVFVEVLNRVVDTSLFPRAIDFNGDSRPDIYLPSLLISDLADAILLQDAGGFSPLFIAPQASFFDSLADLDADGFIDVLSFENNTLLIQLGGAD